MKICHVIQHSCIRVHKLAQAQRTKGDVTPFLYNSTFAETHPHWQYELVFKMFTMKGQCYLLELEQNVKVIDPWIDAWHVHNTPDVFAPIIRNNSQKPVFWDVHDLRSFQHKDETFRHYEDESAKAANHIFTVSPDYVDLLKTRYPDRPITHYRSMVPKEWFPKPVPPSRDGIVYQGGLSSRPGHYRNIFPYIDEAEIPFHIYPASTVEPGQWSIPQNSTMDQCTGLFELYRGISKFEAGFVGTYGEHEAFKGALPNKLFEYLACGVPILAANVPAVSEFLEENPGLGVTANDPKEAKEALKKIKKDKLRANVVKQRNKFSIDEQNEKFVEPIYKQFL